FFLLNPHSLLTDFLRIDHVILLAILLVTWLSLVVLDDPWSARGNFAWGCAAALLVNTKVTALANLALPVLFILGLPLLKSSYFFPRIRWALGSFCLFFCLFFFRYLCFYESLPATLVERMRELSQWGKVISCEPRWYYNVHAFLTCGYGY